MDEVETRLVGALVDGAAIGLIVINKEKQILYWNRFISRVSGQSLPQAVQRPLTEVFPDIDAGRLEVLIARALQALPAGHMVWVDVANILRLSFPQADGGALLLQSAYLAPFSVQGTPCFGLVLYDVADVLKVRDQVEAALQALNEHEASGKQVLGKLDSVNSRMLQTEKLAAIGQLAAGVAHEINNPIGYVFSNLKALGGYVQDILRIVDAIDGASGLDELKTLKRELDYDYIRNDVGALVRESEEGIDRVKKIISALKDFSRIEDDEMQLTDLQRGIDTTLNVVNNELKYKAELVKEYAELPEVECIPSQINQVVMNLLVNAAQAIDGFGRITLRTAQEDGWIWLEVEDTGAGMKADVVKRIFEPFYTTKPVGKGTGLGLSLSYNIIQKHSGRIDVFSEPGKGSRFRVWLPLRQPAKSDRPAALPPVSR